jgi:hypothetical protein
MRARSGTLDRNDRARIMGLCRKLGAPSVKMLCSSRDVVLQLAESWYDASRHVPGKAPAIRDKPEMFAQRPDSAREPQYQYIRAEDFAAYERWCTPHVTTFNPVPTTPLYHYTTGNGLIEIIRSGELWSTQVACLNDSLELLYPSKLLNDKVRAKSASAISAEVDFLLKQIDHGIADPAIDTEGWFVACFSEDGDDLSQWRAYGGGEGGYAIEFDSEYIRLLQNPTMVLGKVEYNAERQDLFIENLLNNCIMFYLDGLRKRRSPSSEQWTSEFLLCWSNLAMVFAPFIKHPKFNGEREWRLVYHLDDDGIRRKRYLQRRSMMTQHVPLRLKLHEDGTPCLPLTGIVVGPSRHKEISKISVNDLLRTHGYPPCARLTEIPYRVV